MFKYEFMRNAFMAGMLISVLCPVIGSFLVLKRFSLMGDTLSHSAFAGVASALFLGYNPGIFSLIYTIASAVAIEFLRKRFRSYQEVIMSVILTFNTGLAIVLASSRKIGTSINQFLFGSVLTVTRKDIILVAGVTAAVLLFVAVFYKKMLYSTFDEEGASIHGIKTERINYIFAVLTGATIGVSLRITGLLVISAVLVLPVAAALNLRRGFRDTLIISIVCGIITVVSGLLISYNFDLAPGGTIALVSVAVLLVSLIYDISSWNN